VALNTFLKECNVPHYIVLRDGNDYRLFDEDVYVATDPDDSYYLKKFFKKKFNNDQNEAYLFEKPSKISYLIKKIKNYYQPQYYTGGSITNGSIVVKIEHEEAFVIFNPNSSRSVDDVVLPLESQKNNPSRTLPNYLTNWHYQTLF
jgi:hypothetical protein